MLRSLSLFLISVSFLGIVSSHAAEVKNSDLAGSWYSASKTQLEDQLKGYLDAANPPELEGRILAIIVPHAGYIYSGPVAAYGYKVVQNKGINTIIVLGFSHRQYLDGVSVYGGDSWKTPLGEIAVNTAMAGKIISSNPRFRFQKELFDGENSVEMQIPFIQMALNKPSLRATEGSEAISKRGIASAASWPRNDNEIKIVPIAFGNQNYSDAYALATVLADLIKERSDCLIVASTDLSHYYPYQDASSIDKRTIDTLGRLRAKEFYDEAKMGSCELCGLMPVTASLLVAQMLGYDKIKTLKYANSGDITGDKAKVVGYVSSVIYKEEIASAATFGGEPRNDGIYPLRHSLNDVAQEVKSNMLNDSQRKRLLQIARESITSLVKDGKRKTFVEKDAILNQSMGAFVTLHEAGELRGCIGNMVGQGPLYQTIADMAIEAATGDPRFQKLSVGEIDKIDIEISVLSPLQKVKNSDEIKIPGHGVIVKRGFNSGVYLPQVANETGWSKEEFLTSLCAHKARLAPDAWKDPTTEIYIFTAEVFGEGGK
ncbi:MAG: AmmeMemoRadiSam system protein B [Candidatus Omnitrophota bacterium]|nr:AmmeMemoRadiSam system protein B [Candidatus Omnitrophota bacterium]